MDTKMNVPQRITMYEFDVNAAVKNTTAEVGDLIYKIKDYPRDFGMASLATKEFLALINRIKTEEETAVNFINKMCPDVECYVKECDKTCREQLACILGNSSQQEIIQCRGLGIQDREYGLDYLFS